jgi:quinoprotein dehydrogenase-associated probable ABC transporter substrate-binding protein
MKRRVLVANKLIALLCLIGLCGFQSARAQAADSGVVDLVNRKVLRVCSDPHNMPFSNEAGEGFENKIADVIADELKVPVEYTWYPMSTGFVRMTLFSKRCDVIIGYAQGDELVLNSNAYYRSTYALVYKQGAGLDGVDSLADPKLKEKRIGVVANTPPGFAMVKHGLMAKAKPYPLVVDTRFDSSGEAIAKDVQAGEIDAGVLWGPLAGYYATKTAKPPLTVKPLALDASVTTKMSYGITLGVRLSDTDWKKQLNTILTKRRADIDKILLAYGVPLVDDQNAQITAPRQ